MAGRFAIAVCAVVVLVLPTSGTSQGIPSVVDLLRESQYDLSEDGRAVLLAEASQAAFFLLGELHFTKEIPDLLTALWPDLWQSGYRHVAAEMSPWTANRAEFPRDGAATSFIGLWTAAEVELVTGLKREGAPAVLWGSDVEVFSPRLILQELAGENRDNPHLQAMVEATAGGYRRSQASLLGELLEQAAAVQPELSEDLHRFGNIAHTFAVTADRLGGERLKASYRREEAMKELFLSHYSAHAEATGAKVLVRFGRNHLHRGIDRRGVSTLGNLIAEIAAARGLTSFHLAAFGAGGRIRSGFATVDADETSEDPAFELLASLARHPVTVFDLRPARPALHAIPLSKRSAAERSLVYWADSYDAIICFREVTPLR